jgi:acyl-CoA hydrolase
MVRADYDQSRRFVLIAKRESAMHIVENAKRNLEKEYQQKLCTAAEAAATVKSGDFLCFPIAVGEPTLFVRALAARKHEPEGVIINSTFALA